MPKRTIILLLILSGALVISMLRLIASPTTLVVEITQDGRLTLDGEAVASEDLRPVIEAALADDPNARVIIYAESKMPAAEVVRIAQIVEQAGALVELNSRAP